MIVLLKKIVDRYDFFDPNYDGEPYVEYTCRVSGFENIEAVTLIGFSNYKDGKPTEFRRNSTPNRHFLNDEENTVANLIIDKIWESFKSSGEFEGDYEFEL